MTLAMYGLAVQSLDDVSSRAILLLRELFPEESNVSYISTAFVEEATDLGWLTQQSRKLTFFVEKGTHVPPVIPECREGFIRYCPKTKPSTNPKDKPQGVPQVVA